jgi:hypothetical protein
MTRRKKAAQFELPAPTNVQASQLFYVWGMIGARLTAARGTWPWTVMRETFLLMSGEARSAGREVMRLQREKLIGPVAAVVLARSSLAGRRNGAMFAREALGRKEPDAFVDDLRFLFDGKAPLSRGLIAAAEELRRMDDADVQAIAQTLADPWRALFVHVAKELKRRGGEPPKDIILDVLRSLWDRGIHVPFEAALRKLAS